MLHIALSVLVKASGKGVGDLMACCIVARCIEGSGGVNDRVTYEM